ncbi:DUF6173 family protein [Acinetobacter bereziniae]|uniref:DUF6173 family protein n=1 Tax=Acinetobacter bereziniae TaxID=106648 RepID=UPI00124F8E40|nr:DUF6173 family protein [Acinetobacter bereziniae]
MSTSKGQVTNAYNSIRQMDDIIASQLRAKHRTENPVVAIQETIELNIKKFESNLEDGYELGAWLASFGNQILIIVENIEFAKPSIIIFHGRDNEGNKLQLIQHANQLNLLLNAVKKQTDQPRQQIGFIHN